MRPVSRDVYPFDGRRLDLGGHGLHYLDEGAGPPVLMVHGNGTWSFAYRALVLGLRDAYRCVVPDLMGMGRSDKPGDDQYEYTLDRRVEDLDQLVMSLGLEGVTLVGHDWGGMVAMAWARRRPECIRRFVMMNTVAFRNPAHLPLPPSMTIMRSPLGPLLVRGLNLITRGMMWRGTARPMPRDVVRAHMAPYDSWANRVAVHRFVQDVPMKPGDRAWGTIGATEAALTELAKDRPALLCWGLRDFLVKPGYLDAWIRHWPGAEVQRLPEAGHFLLEDAPDQVIKLVRDFLVRTDGAVR